MKKEKKKANLQQAVPGAGAEGVSVRRDTEAADTVVVGGEHSHTLPFQGVPDVAVEVIVTSEEESARH